MEATNTDDQSIETPVVQETDKDNQQPTQFDTMSQEELLNYAVNLQSRLHTVNEESKGRKLKLRELEAEKTAREQSLLEEQGKYEELYKTANAELEELRPLRTYKEEQDKLQEQKLVDYEKQLTAAEREEFGILGDLPIERKLKWVELKLKNRSSVNLDTSSSVVGGGSLKQRPKNRGELSMLTTEEMKAFKEKYPNEFSAAMKTK